MQEEPIALRPQNSKESQQQQKNQRHLEKKFLRRRPINFGRLALGLFLIFAGIYFFAQKTGFLPAGLRIDVSFAQLWPLLIVFAGLSLLSARSRIIALVGGLLTLVILVIIGYLFLSKSAALEKYSQPIKTTPFQINNEKGNFSKTEININANGIALSVSGNSGPLARGKFVSNVSDLQINSSTRNGKQIASISTKGSFEKFPTKYVNNLDVLIDNQKPLALKIESKASKTKLDLRNFDLDGLALKADVSDLIIHFPHRSTTASLDTRMSNVSLIFPESVGVRIVSSSELSRRDFSGLMEIAQNETYQNIFETKDYDQTEVKINIEIISTLANYDVSWQSQ